MKNIMVNFLNDYSLSLLQVGDRFTLLCCESYVVDYRSDDIVSNKYDNGFIEKYTLIQIKAIRILKSGKIGKSTVWSKFKDYTKQPSIG